MPTFTRTISVGTTPVLALADNPLRSAWRVTLFSTTISAGNTGRVHIGRRVPPTTTVGEPNAGDILVQGSEISESKGFPTEKIFTGELWLTASIASQLVQVEETIEEA